MTVLDASAALALLQREPGAEVVVEVLAGAGPVVMGAANLAEVIGKLADAGVAPQRAHDLLLATGIRIEPVTAPDAVMAGALRTIAGGSRLSLGDRCCLALTLRRESAAVWTGDRAWVDLDLPIEVRLIR